MIFTEEQETEIEIRIDYSMSAYRDAAEWLIKVVASWVRANPDLPDFQGLSCNVWDYGTAFSLDDSRKVIPYHLIEHRIRVSDFLPDFTRNDIYANINQMVEKSLPGAEFYQRFLICDLPQCESHIQQEYRICRDVKDRWVCIECEDEAQKLYNARRSARSSMSPKLRLKILVRDGYACKMCGRTPKDDGIKLEIDHIIPVSEGGKTKEDNLQTLCYECNAGKSNSLLAVA